MTPTPPNAALDEEARITRDALTDEAFANLIERLNKQSVEKHYDAYLDIPWDNPDYAIDHADPRFADAAEGLFGTTDWWTTLDDSTRARLALHLIAIRMRSGLIFENTLSRGLLAYAAKLDNGDPQFRYSYHEVI
jgi:hypothetical protein